MGLGMSHSGDNRLMDICTENVKTRSGKIVCCIKRDMVATTYYLNSLTNREPGVDENVLNHLNESKQINWWRTACLVYPLLTGRPAESTSVTSLMESIVLSIHGCTDTDLVQLLCRLSRDVIMSGAWSEFARHRQADRDVISGQTLTSQNDEWQRVGGLFDVKSSGSADQVESIHIFVVANVIRRSIVVLHDPDDTNIALNCRGVYLPLFHDARLCCRHPVVITVTTTSSISSSSHRLNADSINQYIIFEPLVPYIDTSKQPRLELALPLVGHDLVSLPVRCCHTTDDLQTSVAIEKYLELTDLPYTTKYGVNLIACAQLGNKTSSEQSVSLTAMKSAVDNEIVIEQRQESECIVAGCRFYALRECGGKCTVCYNKDAKKQETTRRVDRGQATTPYSALAGNPVASAGIRTDVMLTSLSPSNQPSKCPVFGCQYYSAADNGGCCSQHQQFASIDQQVVSTCWNASLGCPKLVPATEARRSLSEKRHDDINYHHVTFSNEYQTKQKQCLTKRCLGFVVGDTLMCTSCQLKQQQALCELQEQRTHRLPRLYCTAPTPVAVVTAPSGVVMTMQAVARPCRNQGCDRYGDASFNGFCSVCSPLNQHVNSY